MSLSIHTYTNFHPPIKRPTHVECRRSFDNIQASTIESRKPSSKLSLLHKLFNTLDTAIISFLDRPLHPSVDPSNTLSDNFAPVDELSPTECKVEHGFIPQCLDGVYIRIAPNPQFRPDGPHHYLDGDGMMHSLKISQGRATFCCRYVKTNKYISEHKVRSFVVPNVIGGMQTLGPFLARISLFVSRHVLKLYDINKGFGVANTNLALFGGKLYALCESDLPYEVKVKNHGDIITLERQNFNGKLSINMTAHPKIDPDTKEAFAFRYWVTPPYLTYFWFDANGNKQPNVPLFSIKKPSLTHDLGITKKYAIIFDIQLGVDPMNLIRGGPLVSVDQSKVPRIGVLPRYAMDESDMKWFDVPGLNILHAVNAWDEIDEDGSDVVVLVAPNVLHVEHFFERVDLIRGSMEKVRIHLGTGVVSRNIMSARNLELPVINPAYIAKVNKYVYASILEKTPIKSRMIRTIGMEKLDILTLEDNTDRYESTIASRMYEDNCFGGEPFFVARDPEDPNSKEDDGYVVSYVHDENSGESRFLVMDAQSPTLEVVAAIKLPQRVPYGLHGIFIKEQDLK